VNSRIRTIKLADFPGRTGRGIRIAVIDSGIHPNHPHIGSVEGVIAFDDAGLEHADVIDRLGHGTAVAAAIHEKVPDASLIAVKIFNRNLVTTSAALVAAIQWSIDAGVDLVNLSLGSTNQDRRSMLQELIADAADHRVRIVAAAPTADQNWLPGGLAGAVAVELDWNCPRDECRLVNQLDGGMRAWASGYPRPIPGVPPEQNLKGQSFAVANATGLLALTMGSDPGLTLV
jgi:subtilisin family serine protease